VPQLKGAKLLMSSTAKDEFMGAVRRLAGPSEARAAANLMRRVTVVPDNPSARVAALKRTRTIREPDIRIFGTADQLGVPLLTADARFPRAAKEQGVILDVVIHDSKSFVGR
jgi:predicted nucleic acid-binding protein